MSTRDDTLVKAKIDTLEFIARDCGGGDNPRRIGKHGAIGMDGEFTEDLGEDARTDTITAELTEEEWLKLDKIKRAGKVVDIVHPLFGSYRGRVVSCPYRAGLMDHVDVTITLIEEGEHRQYTILPSLGQAAKSASSAFSDFSDSMDSFTDALGDSLGGDFFSDLGGALDVIDVFGDFVGEVASGVAKTWQEAGAAFDQLSSAVDTVIDVVDAIASIPADAVEYASDVVDNAYSMVSSARELVDAIGSEVADTWRNVQSAAERTMDSVLVEYFGDVTDEALEAILGANPDLIDLAIIPGGYDLRIPVIR